MKRLLSCLFAALAADLLAFVPYDGYKCSFVRELEAGRRQTIVCYGTSLTAGHYCSNPPGLLQSALDARYPGLATVVNSGCGGQSSVWGAKAANIQEKVLAHAPDAVFVEWAINDAVLEATYDPATQTYATKEMQGVSCSLATSLANVKSIVSQIKAALPDCEVILMTMNAVGVNNGTNNEVRHPDLEAYYGQYVTAAAELGILCLDHYANWKALKASDLATFNSYLADGLHPSTAGYQAVMMPLMVSGTGMSASTGPAVKPSNENDIFAWYRFENLGAAGIPLPVGTVLSNELGSAHGLVVCDFGRNGKKKTTGATVSLTRSAPVVGAGTGKFACASENDTTQCANDGALSLKGGNVNALVSVGTVLRVAEGADDRLNLKSFTVEFLYNARGHDFSADKHWMALMTRACAYHYDETTQKETVAAGCDVAQPAIELIYNDSTQLLLRYTSTDDPSSVKSVVLGAAIPPDGDWHHYALTVDGSSAKPAYRFYRDRQLFSSGTLVAPIYYGDETPGAYKRWTFGGSYTGYALPGMLDEIRLAGKVLQPSDMLRLSDGTAVGDVTAHVREAGAATVAATYGTMPETDVSAASQALFDGDTSSLDGCATIGWNWQNSPWRVYYTIGDAYREGESLEITGYSVQRRYPDGVTTDVCNGESPYSWDVYGSDDGTNWTKLDARSGYRGTKKKYDSDVLWGSAAESAFSFDFAEPVAYRRYRLDFIYQNSGSTAKYSVQEVKFFGKVPAPPRPAPSVAVTIDGADRPRAGVPLAAAVEVLSGELPASGVVTNWYSWAYDGSRADATARTADAKGRFTPTAADYGCFVAVELVSDSKVVGASEPLWFSRLPVVYVRTEDGLEPTAAKEAHAGSVRIQGNDEFAEQYSGGLDEVKVRGNSTATDPKKPWKLRLSSKADLFGFGRNKHWVLLTNYEDPSLLRNKTLYDLAKKLGICAMDSTWVEVVFNGTYRGNYQLCEHVRIDPKRVDIFDWEKFVEDGLGGAAEDLSGINVATNDISGGYLYEFDNYWDETSRFMVSAGALRNLPVQFNRPEFLRTHPEMFAYATNRVVEYLSAVQSPDGCAPDGRYWAELCDAKSAAAFFIVNVGFENSDGDGWSRYASLDRGGKLTWGPVWDFDNALGGRMSYWNVIRDGDGAVTDAVPAVNPFVTNETSFCHDWFTAKYNRHEGLNLAPNVAAYDVNANFYPLWTDDPWFCLKLLEKWRSVSGSVEALCRDGGEIDGYADYLERSAILNDALWTSSLAMERHPSAKAIDRFKGVQGNVWWLKRLYAERRRFMDEKTVSLRALMASLRSPLNDHPYENASERFSWSPLAHCKLPTVPYDGSTPGFVVPDYQDFRVSVACDDAAAVRYLVIVDDRALGEFPSDRPLTVPASAFTEEDGLDMVQVLAKDASGTVLHRTYALVKHVTAEEFAREPGEDIHADYVKTAVGNFNGNDGVTLLKWEKTAGVPYGRAWAVVVDMTKGYRFRTCLGDGSGKKASPVGMAAALKAKGYAPVAGINGDFFFTDIAEPTPTGMTVTDSEMVHKGRSPNPTNAFYHIMQLADGSLAHGHAVRTDGSSTGNPDRSYYVAYGGKKIRNAVRTNYTDDGSGAGNYPVRDGRIHDWGDLDSEAAGNVSYPRTLVGIGKNAEGHDIMVLFVSDGRQDDWSTGVRKRDAAMMMIGAGCTEVGALDGGGSSAMWMEGYSAGPMNASYPGLVNRPSDGAPRKVANGLFIVRDDETDTVSVDGCSYPNLDEAMHAAGPGERISVDAATTFSSVPADLAAGPISSSAADPAQTPVTYVGAGTPAVPEGVTLRLSDVVFAAGSRSISACGGTVALSGRVGLDEVAVASPRDFRLAGALDATIRVDCTSATDSGDPFGTASVAPSAIASSLAGLRHPSSATLAAVSRARIDGGSNLYWSDGTFDTSIIDGTEPAASNDLTAKVRSAGAATVTATYGTSPVADVTAASLAMFDGDTVSAAGCASIDWEWQKSPWTVYYTIGSDFRRDSDIILRSYSVQRQYPDGVSVAVANSQSPFRWRLSGSKDGTTWTELDYQDAHRMTAKNVSTEGEPWGSAGTAVQTFEIPAAKQAAYRRYKIDWIYNNKGTGAKYTVQEVKFFGDIVRRRRGFIIMLL